MTTGLFLGRFQPFHKGHLEIIRRALQDCSRVVIALGSAQDANSTDNPFSAKERTEMIKESLKAAGLKGVKVVPVPDINCNDNYVKHVIQHTGPVDIVYAAENKLTGDLFERAGYRIVACRRLYGISGTRIRALMASDGKWHDMVPLSVASIIKIRRKCPTPA
ncbi:MAG: nicotinamide-nucleotide adenylyltransferase [archaeon]